MDEALQVPGIELVVVHQGAEAVLESVPDMPDEGAVLEAPGVLLEELVAQPDVQVLAGAVGVGQQLGQDAGLPTAGLDGLPGGDEQGQQAVVGGRLAAHRGQADDAVVIHMAGQGLAARDPGAGLVGEFHLGVGLGRPAVAQEAGDGDLQRVGGGLGVAVEEPLGGVVGIGLGQSVGVAFGGDLLPAFTVKGNLDQGRVGDLERLLVNLSNRARIVIEEQNDQTSREILAIILGTISSLHWYQISNHHRARPATHPLQLIATPFRPQHFFPADRAAYLGLAVAAKLRIRPCPTRKV